MVVLAAACLGIGLLAPVVVKLVLPAVRSSSGPHGHRQKRLTASLRTSVTIAIRSLTGVVHVSAALLLLVIGLFLVRRYLPRGREETATGTWDCGYARPTARMQYTASSFAQPLTDLFQIFLGTRKHGAAAAGLLPAADDIRDAHAGCGTRAPVRPAVPADRSGAVPDTPDAAWTHPRVPALHRDRPGAAAASGRREARS